MIEFPAHMVGKGKTKGILDEPNYNEMRKEEHGNILSIAVSPDKTTWRVKYNETILCNLWKLNACIMTQTLYMYYSEEILRVWSFESEGIKPQGIAHEKDGHQKEDEGYRVQMRSRMGTATAPARAMPIELQTLATPMLYSRVSSGICKQTVKWNESPVYWFNLTNAETTNLFYHCRVCREEDDCFVRYTAITP